MAECFIVRRGGKTLGQATGDATAVAADILAAKTAYVNGLLVTGTATDRKGKGFSVDRAYIYEAKGGWLTFKLNATGVIDANTYVSLSLNNFAATTIKAGTKIGNADVEGAYILGTFTADANATNADILVGKTAYVNGSLKTGAMPLGVADADVTSYVRGATNIFVKIPKGYYDGEKSLKIPGGGTPIKAENIKKGVSILGLAGTLESAPYAFGTAYGAGPKSFTPAGDTAAQSYKYIEVSGLTFKPKRIIAIGTLTLDSVYSTAMAVYIEEAVETHVADVVRCSYHQTNLYRGLNMNFRANSADGYVNATGFRIPLYTGDGWANVEWQAWG